MNTSFLWHALSSGSLLLTGLLLLKNISKNNIKANRWLAVFFICVAAIFIQLLIESISVSTPWHWLISILELTRWATFPCFFIALTYFVNPIASSKSIFSHFIPFFLFSLFAIFFLFPSTYAGVSISFQLPEFVVLIIKYFVVGQAILYGFLSILLLRRHKRQIERFSANIENVDLIWVKWVLLAVLGMTTIWIVGKNNTVIVDIVPVGYFILALFISYKSINQQMIYPVKSTELTDVINAITKPTKQYIRLTDEQVEILGERVNKVVRSEKLYLDPLLNLPVLAEQVGVGTHELSFVLNQGFNKNFYQYINDIRVEEAKGLLKNPEFSKMDIASLAIHAGFNSKTTFYTAFKKSTGLTPKAYMEENK